MSKHMDFDRSDEDDVSHVAWCAVCDGPAELDEQGRCASCVENGDGHDVESVIHESVPRTSPRSIECRLCGADVGEYCRPGEDGGGFNHTARVDEHEDRGVLAARPVQR